MASIASWRMTMSVQMCMRAERAPNDPGSGVPDYCAVPPANSDHAASYLSAVATLAQRIEPERLDALAQALAGLRDRGGRLFILGVGGGAGHASHAVNDFRKLCHIESY